MSGVKSLDLINQKHSNHIYTNIHLYIYIYICISNKLKVHHGAWVAT